jgi:hypothetical protein
LPYSVVSFSKAAIFFFLSSFDIDFSHLKFSKRKFIKKRENPLSDKFQLVFSQHDVFFRSVCSLCAIAFLTIFLCLFFSVDLRERDPKAAKRWSDETVFSNRAYFLFDKLPGELAVQNVKDSDTGKLI